MTPTRPARLWLGALLIAALPPLLALWTDRPATPLTAEAPATEFSEARAFPIVEELAGTIGHRLAGSAGARRGEDYLLERLREIPRLEVEVQAAVGQRGSVRYHVRNVVVRLPGDGPEAVLLSAHYDSAPGSVGAADDAVGVAAAVEIARALAAGPRLRHTVVLDLNEGEELGLFGSEAFLEHRWAQDVRAFVNLESAGAGGRPMLFQAGSAALVAAYGRGAPHPHGSVFAQDVFDSGIIPSDTDYRIYRDAGWPGLDLALYQDGWAYHTHLDRPERVERGSLQEMGANALGFVREMASGEWPADAAPEAPIFYDVLGLVLVRYSHGTARVLALLALVLTVFAVVAGLKRSRLTVRTLLVGGAVNALVLVAAVGLSLAIAWLTAGLLDRPFGWYARPWLAVVAFGAPVLGVVFATHGVIAAPWASRAAPAGTAGGSLGASARAMLLSTQPISASLAVVALTFSDLGSGYLALAWALPGALALRLAATRPDRPLLALALGYAPGALLTSQVAVALVTNFVPMAGRMSIGVPMDYAIAAIVALPTALCALAAAPALHHVPSRLWRPAAGACLAIGVAATGYMAVVAPSTSAPSTSERPRRVRLSLAAGGERLLRLHSLDRLPLGAVVAGLPGGVPGRNRYEGATDLALPTAPTLEVVGTEDGTDGTRHLTLRLTPHGATFVAIEIPAGPHLGTDAGTRHSLGFMAPPKDGVSFTVTVPAAPVEAQVRATHLVLPPGVAALVRSLHSHVAVSASVTLETRVDLSPR